ncbi:MAG TPA: hypothetical protein VLF59_03965 [Candidatus Saccharimonadales bacterium]|nr:hypothetical protein [Candidatus Saccharimonadales bacterium]
MHTRTRSKFLTIASLTALMVVASPAAAVYAMHGSDDADATSSTPGSSVISADDSQTDSVAAGDSQSDHSSDIVTLHTGTTTERESSLRARAAQLLTDKRQKGKERSLAVRQQACKRHELGIDNRFATLGTKATKHLDAFDSIFVKVQAYQTAHDLQVANYDTLLADAQAKQASAKAAVDALSALAGTKIDCTAADPAATVATVKTVAGDARTALQAYRVSLKTLVRALLAAKRSTSSSSSPTDTSGTSTTPDTTTSGGN